MKSISTPRWKNANNILGHRVLYLCFRSEEIKDLISEGGEKTFKKNIKPIFGKVNEGALIKKS